VSERQYIHQRVKASEIEKGAWTGSDGLPFSR